jgi:hypothetical protein
MAAHEGVSPVGAGKLSSAAFMAANAQKIWSSLPSVLLWLDGTKLSMPFAPAWWLMAWTTTSLYVVSPVSEEHVLLASLYAFAMRMSRLTKPVFNHIHEHGAGFPPVVRVGQVSRHISSVVTGVVLHHSICNRARSRLDLSGILDIDSKAGSLAGQQRSASPLE